jgi:RHS repeat-associated protein
MDTYNWDVSTGRLTSRNVAGRAESFTWDPLGRLGSVTGPDGTDSFTYGADGERVMRTTPAGRTVYIAGHEVTANLNGTNVRATRSYRFGGQLIATRSPTGLDYIISDQQGTVEATYASGGNLETSRSYLPYGKRRSGGEFDTDQGWLGEIEDDHASLSYMNARYYDANIGMFISPDPIIDTAHPKSLNAYAYALNNPITYSDPTGLCAAIDGLCPQRWKDPYAIAIASTHAGTAQSLMYRRIRPKDYHYSPDRAQSLTGGDLVALAIAKLYALNADPGFWQAVAAAGGGAAFIGAAQSIAVGNLMRVNPDPGFWNAVAAAGGGAAFLAAIRRMMARRSAIGRYELEFAEVNHPSKHPNTDTWDSTDSVDRTHQVSPDHMYSPFGLANPFPDPAPSCTYKAGEVCVTGNVPGPHPTRTGPPTTSVRTTNDGSSFCGPAGVMSPVPTDGLSAGYTIVSNAVGFILKSLSLPLTGLSGGAGIVSGGCATDSNQPGFDGTYVSPQGVPGCDKGQC